MYFDKSLAQLSNSEAAMLAGTHWLNAALHRMAATEPASDVFHTYLLTVNAYRKLCVANEEMVRALSEIEDLRPPFVRGNMPGAEAAADIGEALPPESLACTA